MKIFSIIPQTILELNKLNSETAATLSIAFFSFLNGEEWKSDDEVVNAFREVIVALYENGDENVAAAHFGKVYSLYKDKIVKI